MMQGEKSGRSGSRQGRVVAVVIAVAMVLWLAVQFAGGALGIDPRYAFLADFAALAAFAWALIVTWQIWRKGRDE